MRTIILKRSNFIIPLLAFTTICVIQITVQQLISQPIINIKMSRSEWVGYVSDQIVVNFDDQTTGSINKSTALEYGRTGIAQIDELGQQLNVSSLTQRFPDAPIRHYQGKLIDLRGWFTVKFSSSVDVETCCDLYRQIPGVTDAQPIGIHTVDVVPNDYYFNQQWHLDQANDHDIDAPEAWDRQTGNPVIIVGVMDTGVRYYHKDLGGLTASYSTPLNSRGNMWINAMELNAGIPDGVDNDGNSYVDDWIGWDFVTGITSGGGYFTISGEDYNTPDNDPSDFNGHGTHCAGNVSAINNNGYASSSPAGGWGDGTLQVNANGVKVMALRIGYSMNHIFYGEVGLVRMDFAASAFYYAANNGARIVSCSWGSSNSGGLAAAVDYFLAGGGLIFKAAGNDNNSTADYLCGRPDENIISVAATDQSDLKASFSNFGPWVDISAPGVDILSSYHYHPFPENDYVATISGTSMATPIAASTAALIWSANPDLTANQVRTILFNNTDDIDALNPSYAGLLGVGRVNAYSPLLDPTLPVELAVFTATYNPGEIVLEWETFSEIENLGFEIFRSQSDESNYQLIASYQTNPVLVGLGNSTCGKQYQYFDRDITPGFIYRYVLYDVDYSGNRTAHGPIFVDLREGSEDHPDMAMPSEELCLSPNFPNPFNPFTRFQFYVPPQQQKDILLRINIYDMNGRCVKNLSKKFLSYGWHTIVWDGRNDNGLPLPTGFYFYHCQAGSYHRQGKMILIR